MICHRLTLMREPLLHLRGVVRDILKRHLVGVFGFFFILFYSPSCFASKQGDIKQGNKLYHQGKYEAAADKFNDALKKDSDSDIINFNLGAALYKKEEYPKAVEHFQKSLLSDDKVIQTNAHYNLGNSLYKSGIGKEDTDLKTAIQSLQEAAGHYEKTLSVDTKDQDAQFNYEFVKKELERLKEKLKQQQRKQQKPEDKEEKSEQHSGHQEQSQQQKSQDAHETQGHGAKEQEKQQEQEEIQTQADQKQTQESQNKKEEQSGSQSPEQADSGKQTAVLKPGELSDKEAQMLLENYQQTEEPRGLLNLRLQRGREKEVERDW